MSEAVSQSMIRSLDIEAAALLDLTRTVDLTAMSDAVDLLASVPLITTCASGTSGVAAAKFAYTLCCIERPAKFLPPAEATHGGAGFIQPGSAVVMVSRGGKTSELLPIADMAIQRDATLIILTEQLTSPLAGKADLVLPFRVPRESDPLNLMSTTSFLVAVAIFDALIAGLISRTGYTREQFGLIHPGGAVGAAIAHQIPTS